MNSRDLFRRMGVEYPVEMMREDMKVAEITDICWDGDKITPDVTDQFQRIIYEHYEKAGREFPWRSTHNPYYILVSEVMLQQTQTERVVQKYEEFICSFPDFEALAGAALRDILAVWMGLGYNRRGKALKRLAEILVRDFGGTLPSRPEELLTLPGVGRATASAVMAFAFGRPAVLLETNIRRVFLHFFFRGRERVADKEILPLVDKTLDTRDPRKWYYALMDYGVILKAKYPNANRRSAHYRRQAPFENSDRRIRGGVLRTLLREGSTTEYVIAQKLGTGRGRMKKVIRDLEREGFIRKERKRWTVV